MELWNDILNTALLGTEKRPATGIALPAQLKEAASQITQQSIDPEEQFLQLAALSFNMRQSGQKPPHNTGNFPQAEAESFPYCSPRAAQLLKDILEAETMPLVTSWLEACEKAQQITQPELVPILLNKAVHNKDIRPIVAKVCGRRGEWLSRLNPEWQFSVTTDEEQLWQTGTPDQRKTVLKTMRQHDPAKAREWLTQCWPQENANTRTELLKQLDASIQPEDEEFLQAQLNEKSQKLRDQAAHLLKQLPTSQLVKNYIDLARPLIFLKKEKALLGLTTKTTLHIELPAIPDKGEYAPGIEKLSSDKTFTDGEFILFQLLQATPPSYWEEHFALPPQDILALFSGKTEKYLPAFVKGTVQFRDRKWASAYYEHKDMFYPEILPLLSPEYQDAYALRNLEKNLMAILELVRNTTAEWSPKLAKEILSHAAKDPYRFSITFYKHAIHLIPISIANLIDGFGPNETHLKSLWTNIANQLKTLLNLKEQIQTAFNV